MKCNHENCTKEATVMNRQYFDGIWYCTYHANKKTKECRRTRKYGNRIKHTT